MPPECYDTIDGYLDVKSFVIKSYNDGKEVRRPDVKERDWIKENCRVGELEKDENDEGKSQS